MKCNQGHQNWKENVKELIIMQGLKDLALIVTRKGTSINVFIEPIKTWIISHKYLSSLRKVICRDLCKHSEFMLRLNLIEWELNDKIQCGVLPVSDTLMTHNIKVIKGGMSWSSTIIAILVLGLKNLTETASENNQNQVSWLDLDETEHAAIISLFEHKRDGAI